MKKTLCVTWFSHRRTIELCNYFDFPLDELISDYRGLRRYLELSIRTWHFLRIKRPQVLIVQNPSLVLALVCLLLRVWFGYKLVLDAHNEAVEPFTHTSSAIVWVTNHLLRRADRIIVTNQQLAKVVEEQGGIPLVLPDRVPSPPLSVSSFDISEKFNIAVIATFAADEPIEQIFSAAGQLVSECHFYVTGNYNKLANNILDKAASNISFCGFLPEQEYWGLLKSCDIVVDLTLKDNCLVCGAYEAIAVGTPILLSDNQASIDLFGDMALFTDNSVESIRSSLLRARLTIEDLRARTLNGKSQMEVTWAGKAEVVRRDIEKLLESFL